MTKQLKLIESDPLPSKQGAPKKFDDFHLKNDKSQVQIPDLALKYVPNRSMAAFVEHQIF